MDRRTKIVCTLGPASAKPETIRDLVKAGMNVARLNLSHGTHAIHGQLIDRVREAAAAENRIIPILLDLQGPKIRVGDIPDGSVELRTGKKVILTHREGVKTSEDCIFISYPTLAQDVSPGREILIDDGNLELRIVEVCGDDVVAEVIVGGRLASRKGVNLPNIRTSTPALTDKDLRDLEFGLERGVDLIALSFVRDETDMDDLCSRVGSSGRRPMLIAKIEKPEAVDRIDAIIDRSDAVMVARGDLGIEMRLSKVPGAQKSIIKKCLAAAKPVITATQMLESMIVAPRPTRAEVSDVANAVYDGTDAVMLSGETAMGKYPVKSVETMSSIIAETESDYDSYAESNAYPTEGVTQAVSRTATDLAHQIGAKAIACLTATGATARSIARNRPDAPVYAFTDDRHILGQLALSWGTNGIYIPFQGDTDSGIELVHQTLKSMGLADGGDLIVVTAGMPLPAKGRTNMVHVSRL